MDDAEKQQITWPFQHNDSHCERYRLEGLWRDQTIALQLERLLRDKPDAIAIEDGDNRISFGQLDVEARRLAAHLEGWGVRKGDVISFQLPNWYEVAVIDLAATLLGAVSNPIVPIYREKEVQYILADARSKVVFIPERFQRFDYGQMMARMRPGLRFLEKVVSVRGKGGDASLAELLSDGSSYSRAAQLHPDAPKLLMYTSGTTGRPKGVVHSSNTLDAELGSAVRYLSMSDEDVSIMPSPVTHITGYLYGILFPFAYGVKSVLMDRWNAADAAELIQKHGATFTIGATPFLQELVQEVEKTGASLATFRFFGCGGAPVPPELVHRAYKALPNTVVCRVYGSTEAPTVSFGVASRDEEALAASTDGKIVGHDVRIVDDVGDPVPDGVEGEITTRGPELMLGYLAIEDNNEAFDALGYFRTGDIGFRTPEDCIVISGRRKDLIIRGGENISAKEIEDALFEYPGMLEVAVVAMPHPRMGETACAYVRVKPGTSIDVEAVSSFLSAYGLAKQKHPERIEIVDELPRTASGKVQKFLLRESIKRKISR